MEWEKREKDRMDRRVFCSKRCVSIREKKWVIRDLEDCYWGRQFIPAPRSYRKAALRLVNGRVKMRKWMWRVLRWSAGMYCYIVHHVLYCSITSRLSDSEIRRVVQPLHIVCWFSGKVTCPLVIHWAQSPGEIQAATLVIDFIGLAMMLVICIFNQLFLHNHGPLKVYDYEERPHLTDRYGHVAGETLYFIFVSQNIVFTATSQLAQLRKTFNRTNWRADKCSHKGGRTMISSPPAPTSLPLAEGLSKLHKKTGALS